MQITSIGVQLASAPDAPIYTWQQTWRFFVIGAVYAVGSAILPVAWQLWYNYENYAGPIDWPLLWGTIASTTGPAIYLYWREHRALLKIPPFFDIPDEFKPQLKQVTTMKQTVTTSGTGDGSKVIDTVKETHIEPMPPKPPDV